VLVTTAGFASQARERRGTITRAKPKAVRDWQAAARKATPKAAARMSRLNAFAVQKMVSPRSI